MAQAKLTNATALVAGMLASGCVNAPPLALNAPIEGNDQGKVTRTVDHIACELAEVKAKLSPRFDKYAAAAQLTIKTEDTGGVTPSLNFIKPLAVASTSRTRTIGGEFTRGRLKTFTQNVIFVTDELRKAADCNSSNDPVLLTGRLGLEEVILAGLNVLSPNAAGIHWADDKLKAAAAPQFGSTIQFTTKVGVNGGPSLNKVKFKGYGASNGLLNTSRTSTDILVIAFAPVPPVEPPKPPPAAAAPDRKGSANLLEQLTRVTVAPPPTPPAAAPTPEDMAASTEAARRSAVSAAQQLLNSMILQNINPTSP